MVQLPVVHFDPYPSDGLSSVFRTWELTKLLLLLHAIRAAYNICRLLILIR